MRLGRHREAAIGLALLLRLSAVALLLIGLGLLSPRASVATPPTGGPPGVASVVVKNLYAGQTATVQVTLTGTSPATGTFLSVDPLDRAAGQPALSAYAYADDLPTVLADPSGMLGCGILARVCDTAVDTTNKSIDVAKGVVDAGADLSKAAVHTATHPWEVGQALGYAAWRAEDNWNQGGPLQVVRAASGWLAAPFEACLFGGSAGLEGTSRACTKAVASVFAVGRVARAVTDIDRLALAERLATLREATVGRATGILTRVASEERGSSVAFARPTPRRGTIGAAEGGVESIDPALVRFSQSSIKGSFDGHGTIDDLAAGLRNGSIKTEDIPPIRVVERNGNLFTLDNRRLEAFRRAGVPIRYRYATPEEAASESWKFTTRNNGESIRVRGGG